MTAITAHVTPAQAKQIARVRASSGKTYGEMLAAFAKAYAAGVFDDDNDTANTDSKKGK